MKFWERLFRKITAKNQKRYARPRAPRKKVPRKGPEAARFSGPEVSIENLPGEKMKVEKAKFRAGEGLAERSKERKEITLPPAYGDNKIAAMVRDPWWIHLYWEITPQRDGEIRKRMEEEGAAYDYSILRAYDITGIENFNGNNANSNFDIRLKDMAQNWYIDVATPNRDWCVDIGLLAKDGRFYTLARSNYVHTPRFGMSEVLDEEWMCPEDTYWQLFGLSGGFGIGKSSLEIKEIFEKYFKEWVSSGAISSFGGFVSSRI